MIRGFSQSTQPIEAIKIYFKMYCFHGFSGDNMTFIFVFKACARVLDIKTGQKFHVHAVKLGFDSYLFVANALIHMYSSCGDLDFTRKMFDTMGKRDLVSWNSLICGYSQCKKFKELLGLFNAMQEANVKVDAVTMVKVILTSCYTDNMGLADSMVKYIEENCIHIDVYLGNTLIDMYGKRGLVNLAREVFDRMPVRNLVSWNSLIKGYIKAGQVVEAYGVRFVFGITVLPGPTRGQNVLLANPSFLESSRENIIQLWNAVREPQCVFSHHFYFLVASNTAVRLCSFLLHDV